MNEQVKNPMNSRTIQLNAAVMALLPLLRLFNIDIPEETVVALLPLANILLRMVTSQPIGK